MATSSRDRISVDLRGLGVKLTSRADAMGMSPSAFVRTAVIHELERCGGDALCDCKRGGAAGGRHARLCLRMKPAHASLIVAAAGRAGMSLGSYVGGLAAGVPAITLSGYQDHVRALRTSTAELATLSRHVHRMCELLRHGDLPQARDNRDMLDRMAGDVRAHLRLAAEMLAGLQSGSGGSRGIVTAAV